MFSSNSRVSAVYWPSTTVLDNSNTTAAEASAPIVTNGNGRRRRLRSVVVSHSRDGRFRRFFSRWSTKTQVLRLRPASNEAPDDVLSSPCRPLRATILSLVAMSKISATPRVNGMHLAYESNAYIRFVGSLFRYHVATISARQVKDNASSP